MQISLIGAIASFIMLLGFVVATAFYMFFHKEDSRIKHREFPVLVVLGMAEWCAACCWSIVRGTPRSSLLLMYALTTVAVFAPELVMIPSMFVVEVSAFSSSRLTSFGKCISDDLDIDMSRRVILDGLLACFSKTSNIPH